MRWACCLAKSAGTRVPFHHRVGAFKNKTVARQSVHWADASAGLKPPLGGCRLPLAAKGCSVTTDVVTELAFPRSRVLKQPGSVTTDVVTEWVILALFQPNERRFPRGLPFLVFGVANHNRRGATVGTGLEAEPVAGFGQVVAIERLARLPMGLLLTVPLAPIPVQVTPEGDTDFQRLKLGVRCGLHQNLGGGKKRHWWVVSFHLSFLRFKVNIIQNGRHCPSFLMSPQ